MNAPFTVILCEGYHDRAFLHGALISALGWIDPGDHRGGRRPFDDRWGQVGGGAFGFRKQPGDAAIRVKPCQGHTEILPAAARILKDRLIRPFDRLVLCFDGDKGGTGADYLENIHRAVATMVTQLGINAVQVAPGRWRLNQEWIEVCTLVWHVPGTTREGVPPQQCLERLVCSAAAEVWPERSKEIDRWLSEPDRSSSFSGTPGLTPKSYSWSWMGAWFAEHGCDAFYQVMWTQPLLARALMRHLDATGAWSTLEACVRASDDLKPAIGAP